MKKRGLKLKIRPKPVEGGPVVGRGNRTAMVLADDVFYGRPILKIPRPALLSIETAGGIELRRELTRFLFEDMVPQKTFNITSEDTIHLFSLAYPLILEDRNPDSVFRAWLDATQSERLTALELTARQRLVLNGTTAEGAVEEMERSRAVILETASNLTAFQARPVVESEAKWALAVIMRHARVVHPHQDVRDTRAPRMYLFPFKELLQVELHPDPMRGITFQEEIILDGAREEEMVLQIARRDMAKGEEVFMWPGRLSNGEMVVRHGKIFAENHAGIGHNMSQPPNWNDNKESKVRREYDKYNCSSLSDFEMRITPKGLPLRNFVKCWRISWLLANGWYTPAYLKRGADLVRWPPPKRYDKQDWLVWTQADAEVNRHILDYCTMMREQLKDTMDAATAQDFRSSADPLDKLLWQVRAEESKAFKACVARAKEIRGSSA